ncbi:MAG: hypothetical protein [Caudoviricetes sp.]|nr:MAG: hypothetical protein [Caudoviricetes sp.]
MFDYKNDELVKSFDDMNTYDNRLMDKLDFDNELASVKNDVLHNLF